MTGMVAEDDPASENLDVYDTKTGWWHPELGDVEVPDGCSLASGDVFITRRVKADGVYGTCGNPGTDEAAIDDGSVYSPRALRSRPPAPATCALQPSSAPPRESPAPVIEIESRPTTGSKCGKRSTGGWRSHLHTPTSVSTDRRRRRSPSNRCRQRTGRSNRDAQRRRARRFATRAYIRHHYTDYDDRLDDATGSLGDDIETDDYREIKRAAHDAVAAFLAVHRHHDATGRNKT